MARGTTYHLRSPAPESQIERVLPAKQMAGRTVFPGDPPKGRSGHPIPMRTYAGLGPRLSDMGGFSNVDRLEPILRNPLLSASNFQLPQTSLELNQWIRYFDRFHPVVGNAMDMHSTVPFSRFALQGIPDTFVLNYYEDMADEMNLFRHILEVSREFDLLGEALPFLIWDDEVGGFSDALVLNPDYVIIAGVMLGGRKKGFRMELQIDHQTRQFIMSPDPLDQEIVADIDPAVVQAAMSGMNAPLDEFNTTHLMRSANPYDPRGVSIVLGCLKDLLYEEQLREAQYQVAGGIARPREIWKLGGADYTPSQQDLADLRTLLSELRNDPNAAVVAHHSIAVDFLQAERRILPITQEMDMIERRILTRLFTSRAMTTGEGPTYANASVAMNILNARYATKRDFIINYIRQKIFLPVALNNEFYSAPKSSEIYGPGPYFHPSKADRKPLIPDFHWLSMVNLTDRQQQISYLMTLQQSMGLPMKILCDILQLDYDEVRQWKIAEAGTIMDPAVYSAYKARTQAEALQSARPTGGTTPTAGGPRPAAPGAGPAQDKTEEISEDVEQDINQDQEAVETKVNDLGAEDRKANERQQPRPPKMSSMAPIDRAREGGWRPRRLGVRSNRSVRV